MQWSTCSSYAPDVSQCVVLFEGRGQNILNYPTLVLLRKRLVHGLWSCGLLFAFWRFNHEDGPSVSINH